MTTAGLKFEAVDSDAADLLSVLADDGTTTTDREWQAFTAALREVADDAGVIDPNRLRPVLRGRIAPQRVGAFTRRALLADLVAYTGRYVVSDDTGSRNSGKPARELRLIAT